MFTVTFKRAGNANWPARLKLELYNGNWKMLNKHCISLNICWILNILK
jgi:hypothetical protein